MKRDALCFLICVFTFVLAGCGSNSEEDDDQKKTPDLTLKTYDQGDLKVPLADYMGVALDGGRVEIAPPQNWKPLPRGSAGDAIIAFRSRASSSVPAILISAADETTEINTLTRDNLDQFVDLLKKDFEAKDKELQEQVRPMVISGKPCARYVSRATLENKEKRTKRTVDRQFLVTVHNGRRYTVELRVDKGRIMQDRDAAYAVLGGMNFLEQATSNNTDPAPSDSTEKTDG